MGLSNILSLSYCLSHEIPPYHNWSNLDQKSTLIWWLLFAIPISIVPFWSKIEQFVAVLFAFIWPPKKNNHNLEKSIKSGLCITRLLKILLFICITYIATSDGSNSVRGFRVRDFGRVRSSVLVGEPGFGRVRSSDLRFGESWRPYNLIIFL